MNPLNVKTSGESLGEWSCFPFEGMAGTAKGHPNKGVPARGMSGKEDTGGGEVTSGEVGTPGGPGTGEPQGLGPGTVGWGLGVMGMPSSCRGAMVVALLV